MRLRAPDAFALAAAALFVVLALTAGTAWESSPRQVSDVDLYRTYGERMQDGRVPYRDFAVEYPPAALPVFALPALVTGTRDGYALALAGMLSLVGAVGLLLVDAVQGLLGRSRRTRRVTSLALALSPLVLGAIVVSRFDLVPATLTVAVLLALLLDRPRLAGALLGLAVAVKLYPAVLLPVAVVWAWRRSGRRAAAWLAGLSVAVPALAYLPFVLVSPSGVAHSIGHQASRPLQFESLGSSLVLAAHHLAGVRITWSSSHGSQNLDGAVPDALALVASLAVLAALVAAWWWHARGPLLPDRLVRASAASVLAFVALGKVLSPQFLLWLILLVPLVDGRSGRLASLLVAVACVLTMLWFPLRYWDLVKELDLAASWLLVARNLCLAAALVAVLAPLRPAARGRAPARSRWPVPSPDRT